jgi:DMSO/TMAO reductase YedYZ molybdopterin-dependent catalytic subunit
MSAPSGRVGLAPGQYYSKRWIYYSALGEPEIRADAWRLKVDGLVERPVRLTLADLERMPQTQLQRDFQCVTKWSIKDVQWEGVRLVEIGKLVGVKPEAQWVIFRCADGYTTPVPVEDALTEEALIALRMNGAPIPAPQGYPARPFLPHLYGWKSAKWLTGIEFVPAYVDGYWEKLGYHERANIWEEERFKGHEGKQQRHRSTGSAPV